MSQQLRDPSPRSRLGDVVQPAAGEPKSARAQLLVPVLAPRENHGIASASTCLNPQLQIVAVEASTDVDEMKVRLFDPTCPQQIRSRHVVDDPLSGEAAPLRGYGILRLRR